MTYRRIELEEIAAKRAILADSLQEQAERRSDVRLARLAERVRRSASRASVRAERLIVSTPAA